MKIQITGDAFVITSSLSAEDIKYVAKTAPSKLNVYEGEGDDRNVVFAISYKEGANNIASFGITFGGKTRDDKGLATFTGLIPAGTANAKDFVADVVAPVVAHLNTLETSVVADAKTLKDQRKELLSKISEA
jgi:hypothetical protein